MPSEVVDSLKELASSGKLSQKMTEKHNPNPDLLLQEM
jgi:hypothetical protein